MTRHWINVIPDYRLSMKMKVIGERDVDTYLSVLIYPYGEIGKHNPMRRGGRKRLLGSSPSMGTN